MAIVLTVRFNLEQEPEAMTRVCRALGICDLVFIEVEPRTPEALKEMVNEHQPVAVLLREKPLPALIMDIVPVIPLVPNAPLRRLVGMTPQLVDL